MSTARRPLLRALLGAGALLAVDLGGAHLLDAAGAADRLLAGGPGALALVPALGLFLAARLALYFVAPGLVLRGLVMAIAGDTPRSPSRGR